MHSALTAYYHNFNIFVHNMRADMGADMRVFMSAPTSALSSHISHHISLHLIFSALIPQALNIKEYYYAQNGSKWAFSRSHAL